jgi:membrane protease YdiL (CAAX protease family)
MLLAKRPTGVTMALLVLVLVIAVQSIPSLIQSAMAAAERAANGEPFSLVVVGATDRWSGVLALLSFGLALLALWLWVAAKERRRFATLGLEGGASSNLRRAARGFGLGLAMIAICVFVPVALGQAQLSWASPDATSWGFILIMLLGFLLQGSTEEVIARGYLTQAVARRWGLVAAIVVQAVFFALLHGMNPGIGLVPILNLLMFALFASVFSLAEGSLWGICALHGAWNWAQGNLFGVRVSGTEVSDSVLGYAAQPGSIDLVTGGDFGLEGSLLTTAVYLVGIAIAWRVFRRKRAAGAAAQAVPAVA